VAKGDKTGIVVAVIPGQNELNFKALAKASGNKKITLVQVKELLELTGYIRGGCSPIGMKKAYPVFIDQDAAQEEIIYVNAGQRGILFGAKPEDIQKVSRAVFAEIGS
jgi:Cys-tRNA(Pro)/Cys-tRNA(Cys) deacylase